MPVHLLFVFLFTSWLINSRDSELSFAFVSLVRERVTQQELHSLDTHVALRLHDVTSVEQAKQFMRGPLLHALFGMQDSTASGPFDVGYVIGQARMLGAARIRQVRVATNSCHVSQLRTLVPTCYPALLDGKRRVAPIYGQDLGGGMRRVYR